MCVKGGFYYDIEDVWWYGFKVKLWCGIKDGYNMVLRVGCIIVI